MMTFPVWRDRIKLFLIEWEGKQLRDFNQFTENEVKILYIKPFYSYYYYTFYYTSTIGDEHFFLFYMLYSENRIAIMLCTIEEAISSLTLFHALLATAAYISLPDSWTNKSQGSQATGGRWNTKSVLKLFAGSSPLSMHICKGRMHTYRLPFRRNA